MVAFSASGPPIFVRARMAEAIENARGCTIVLTSSLARLRNAGTRPAFKFRFKCGSLQATWGWICDRRMLGTILIENFGGVFRSVIDGEQARGIYKLDVNHGAWNL